MSDENKLRWCSCKASARDGQHMAWCPASDKYPHVPAAFINALAEEGTKAETIAFLQQQWNENCVLREENRKLRAALSQQYATTASLLRSDQTPSEG